MTYKVNDVYVAIQGEGALTGQAMVLIRLHGCGVGCPWCDTRETWVASEAHRVARIEDAIGTSPAWAEVGAKELAEYARSLNPSIPWALVTVGEPADQELKPVVDALHAQGFSAALETSGTAPGHLGAGFDWVCVSPKFGMPGGRIVLDRALDAADELKFVIGKEADVEIVDRCLRGLPVRPNRRNVSLQPLSCSDKATALCIKTVKARGWRLSLQTHKGLGER